jgi:hypothetical protein
LQDTFEELIYRSFEDAMDVVADYDTWAEEAFDEPIPVPPQAVPLDRGDALPEPRPGALLRDGPGVARLREPDVRIAFAESWLQISTNLPRTETCHRLRSWILISE